MMNSLVLSWLENVQICAGSGITVRPSYSVSAERDDSTVVVGVGHCAVLDEKSPTQRHIDVPLQTHRDSFLRHFIFEKIKIKSIIEKKSDVANWIISSIYIPT